MTKVYFNNIEKRIIKYLESANESIYCAVAWFTNPKLLKVLIRKVKEGITVYLVIKNERINIKPGGLDFQKFINKGGNFYFDNKENLIHHKFCIIDEQIVISGSYNWTKKAETLNRENILITKNNLVVANFYFEFEDIISDLERIIKTKNAANYEIEENKTSRRNKLLILSKKGHPNVFNIKGKPFRVKLRWYSKDDLDLHMILPNGDEINYEDMGVKYKGKQGTLLKDKNAHKLSKNPVEIIEWEEIPTGEYKIYVKYFQKNEKSIVPFKTTLYAGGERIIIKKKVKEEKIKNVIRFTVN